jgi:hypothetical protein
METSLIELKPELMELDLMKKRGEWFVIKGRPCTDTVLLCLAIDLPPEYMSGISRHN